MQHPYCDFLGWVGPAVRPGLAGEAVVSAIMAENKPVVILEGELLIRILVEGRCSVKYAIIGKFLGRKFAQLSDLQAIMPTYRGVLLATQEEVVWLPISI